jgi:hypothetical protein
MHTRHVSGFGLALIGVCLLVQAPRPQAAPGLTITGVTGTVADNSTVTLTGVGFGTKPTAPPLKYDDFENGTTGSTISNAWEYDGFYYQPTYTTGRVRPNSTRSVRCSWIVPRQPGDDGVNFGLGIRSAWPRDGGNITQLYFDAWYYLESPQPMRNHKLWRLHTGDVGQPNLYMNIYGDSNLNRVGQDGLANAATGYTGYSMDNGDGYGFASMVGRWSHIQVWLTESSIGVQNGRMWVAVNSHVGIDGLVKTRDANTHWNQLFIGNYMSTDLAGGGPLTTDIHTYWDHVYIDTYRQHVEIGNNAVYANATQREIQIPSAWSNTSISVRLNRGGFPSFSGLYLFVVDDAGNVSPGYPLAGGPPPPTTGAPAPPTGLRIVT